MNLTLWLYLVDVAGSLKIYFGWGIVVCLGSVVITIFAGMGMADTGSTTDKQWNKWRWWGCTSVVLFLLSTLLFIALPTNQTLYLMMGAKTAEEVVTNPSVQKIGAKVMAIVDKKLSEMSGDNVSKKESK